MELRNGRVYSYIRAHHFVVYCILLVTCLAADLTTTHLLWINTSAISHWFLYDIPWIVTSLLCWLSTCQWLRYRKTSFTFTLDPENSVCNVHETQFAGQWRVQKKSPRDMTATKVLAPLSSFMILAMIFLNIASLFRRMNSVIGANDLEKFYAVQGLCIAFLLIGVVLPQWSFWKFPYLLVLGRNGQWFSVQYQDEQFEKAPQ